MASLGQAGRQSPQKRHLPASTPQSPSMVMAETGQAVQFFRQQLVSTIQEGSDSDFLDAEDIHIQQLINQFVDEVLFAVLDGYEQSVTQRPITRRK